jgi:hypothetical protein
VARNRGGLGTAVIERLRRQYPRITYHVVQAESATLTTGRAAAPAAKCRNRRRGNDRNPSLYERERGLWLKPLAVGQEGRLSG